jgi:hypothetical protein
MPRYIDYHANLKLPGEVIEQIRAGTKAGEKDQFGVRQIELLHNANGDVYCLLEGPDEDAIRKHHDAAGVPVTSAIHEYDTLL